MKRILLVAMLVLGCVVPTKTLAPADVEVLTPPQVVVVPAPPPESRHTKKQAGQVAAFIRRHNPSVPEKRAKDLARSVVLHAVATKLDPFILAAILAQESTFRPGLHVCRPRASAPQGFTCDIGVGQINWETWGETLKLDRIRLILDDDYNISVAAFILRDLRRRFGGEPDWWTRYHNSAPELRAQYQALVQRHVPTVRL